MPSGHRIAWIGVGIACAILPPHAALSDPTFVDVGAKLPAVHSGAVVWGDLDLDGRLDVVVTGWSWSRSEPITCVLRCEGDGVFRDTGATLPGVYRGAVALGDFDGDGKLDLLLGGATDSGCLCRVYRNEGGGFFADVGAGLPGVADGALAWGDFDGDGKLDVVLTGRDEADQIITRLYRNEGGGVFRDVYARLPGVAWSALAWADANGDGRPDLLLTGWTGKTWISRVFRNDGGGAFTDMEAGLPGVDSGSAAWGDLDHDGRPDILLAGTSRAGPICRIYRNDGRGGFADVHAVLPALAHGSVAWGDYDRDGDLDVLITGTDGGGASVARICRNDGGAVFREIDAGLPGVDGGSATWGDYDGDGALDILISGYGESGPVCAVYRGIRGSAASGR